MRGSVPAGRRPCGWRSVTSKQHPVSRGDHGHQTMDEEAGLQLWSACVGAWAGDLWIGEIWPERQPACRYRMALLSPLCGESADAYLRLV